MNKGGFSWKRFLGITQAKRDIARKTGVPWTKSGRQQKTGRLVTKGCLGSFLVVLISMIGLVLIGMGL